MLLGVSPDEGNFSVDALGIGKRNKGSAASKAMAMAPRENHMLLLALLLRRLKVLDFGRNGIDRFLDRCIDVPAFLVADIETTGGSCPCLCLFGMYGKDDNHDDDNGNVTNESRNCRCMWYLHTDCFRDRKRSQGRRDTAKDRFYGRGGTKRCN